MFFASEISHVSRPSPSLALTLTSDDARTDAAPGA